MIPRLIHQTAKTDDLSPESQRFQQMVRRLHPDWTYKLWTDADNYQFVQKEFPAFYDIFTRLPKNIMRADVIRYLLMDRLGGLYLDLDYEMLKPFDLLDHECVIPLERDANDGGQQAFLGNAIFAAVPGSRFFRQVIESLAANPPLSEQVEVLSSTGPAFLTKIYHALSDDEKARVTTPARATFHPQSPRNPREYKKTIADPSIYGMHHCHGTWREYSLPQRLRRFASGVVNRFR